MVSSVVILAEERHDPLESPEPPDVSRNRGRVSGDPERSRHQATA